MISRWSCNESAAARGWRCCQILSDSCGKRREYFSEINIGARKFHYLVARLIVLFSVIYMWCGGYRICDFCRVIFYQRQIILVVYCHKKCIVILHIPNSVESRLIKVNGSNINQTKWLKTQIIGTSCSVIYL